ncbi:LysM peptidoglycan-binding domain-containing protein [Paenibacillus hemerocallicola]|uniref:LysM peptidoglycan-binding domain-containing protein n=1 Tax=Paenibacillus hemerocallicola TaxID=1172614 RepID=A0A5C4T2V4_9BACL|nr:LysM peptidoglycan-binding domain-containing protein [Paenibacillus hemerocallicola]TNJ63060.1 LysM peptidoglycan-binding domain-containing protein [Paenibacillus hemerocallicola]
MQIEVVNPGDSLWAIAKRYGVPVDDIVRINEIDEPTRLAVGQALVIPTSDTVHRVVAGESLWTISRRYGVPVEEIIRANNLTNPSQLYVGQRLQIPRQGAKRTIEANGYLQPSSEEKDRTIVNETAEFLTYFSIFQYIVEQNGSLTPPKDEAALAAIANTNSVPMMVITNFEGGTFSSEKARAIFDNAEAKQALIDNVVATLRTKRFFALNVDFEHIFPEDREKYNAFLREITARVHEEGKLASTALAPKVSATQAGRWYEAHDYKAHGEIVDFVIIMTYEWGWSGGPPMAVAPIPQVRQVLDYAVSVIPRNKIMMGAPLYGYNWTLPFTPGGKFAPTLSPKAAVDLARDVGAYIRFDSTAQAPHFSYYDNDGKEHIVWFEDARSMQAKFDLIKEYGLRGISYWVLGQSFPQNWVLLEANFNIKKYK